MPLPEIVSLDWACEDGRRSVEVVTTSWTRGGMLWMDDGERRERHPVSSIAAEVDGTADRLLLTLDLISDVRLVTPGVNSAFLCGEVPLRQLYLISFEYEAADCRRDPGFPEIEGVDPCEVFWP